MGRQARADRPFSRLYLLADEADDLGIDGVGAGFVWFPVDLYWLDTIHEVLLLAHFNFAGLAH